MDTVRRGMENLTSLGIVSFLYMQSEEGPELIGEEELNSKMFKIMEEKNVIELAQVIKFLFWIHFYRLLSTVYFLLSTVYCLLYTVYDLLSTVN